MKVLAARPTEVADEHLSPKAVLARLDSVFAGDWKSREQDIADDMGRLQADFHLLRDWVQHSIGQEALPELQGAQSFVIHRSVNMVARLNLWFPPGKLGHVVPEYRRYLSIDELHNHNFDFFTIALLGSGYTSTYYRLDDWSPDYKAGSRIELGEGKVHRLAGKTVHFVERLYDYHAVNWAEEFSVSLNVMPNNRPDQVQYIVDNSNMTVKFVIGATSSDSEAIYG